MKLFSRLGAVNTVTALLDRSIAWWPTLLAILGSGVVGSIASYYTDWIRPYGTVAHLGVGLLVCLIIVYIIYVIALIRKHLAEAFYAKSIASIVHSVNPLDSNFERKSINISDFQSRFGIINERKTFNECNIYGPGAMALLDGSALNTNSFYFCDVVRVKGGSLLSVAAFSWSSFNNCKFFNITLFVGTAQVEVMKKDLESRGQPLPIIIGFNEPDQPPTSGAHATTPPIRS